MGTTITAKYPFSGKNQICLAAEEITPTTGIPTFGQRTTYTIVGNSPNGNATWKNIGYVTGGTTQESRTMEDVVTIGRRNVQQLAETKFECSGTLNINYQNGRIFYYTIAANNGLGTPTQTGPGIFHTNNVGSITGLNRHIIAEPEVVSGADVMDAVPDPPSFNLLDGYTVAGSSQPKVARQYVGCKIDTLGMTFAKDGTVKADVNWKGAQVYGIQAVTLANLEMSDYLAYEEVFPPVFGQLYLQEWDYPTSAPTWSAALDSSLANSTNLVGDLQSMNFTIANNLEALFVIGDVTARALIAQNRQYTGRMSVAFENESQHIRFLSEITNSYAPDPSGGSAYGVGTWQYPWVAGNRMDYYAIKFFYDNSSLGYTTSSANYRRIEITLLGLKFKSMSAPRQSSGIIYQDYEWEAMLLAPYNATDGVGGIVLYDDITSTNFHSSLS